MGWHTYWAPFQIARLDPRHSSQPWGRSKTIGECIDTYRYIYDIYVSIHALINIIYVPVCVDTCTQCMYRHIQVYILYWWICIYIHHRFGLSQSTSPIFFCLVAIFRLRIRNWNRNWKVTHTHGIWYTSHTHKLQQKLARHPCPLTECVRLRKTLMRKPPHPCLALDSANLVWRKAFLHS